MKGLAVVMQTMTLKILQSNCEFKSATKLFTVSAVNLLNSWCYYGFLEVAEIVIKTKAHKTQKESIYLMT